MTPQPVQKARAQRPRLRRRDSGSALTEFVIVVPCLILLLYWSEFLSDLGLVKMKVEEAARYALWETAAMRQPTAVAAEVQARFKDLSSPQSIMSSTPIGTRSFKTMTVGAPVITTNGPAPFNARLSLNWGGGVGGFIGRIISGLSNFIRNTVDGLVSEFGFNINGTAQASVSFTVQNTLFPGAILFPAQSSPLKLDSDGHSTIQVIAKSPMMLIDVWKAWPNPYAMGSTDTDSDIYQTYGHGSVPENEVSARLRKLAFFGLLNNTIGSMIRGAFTIVGFPDPFSTKTWASNNGPISMLPGDNPRHGGTPGSGIGSQRLGNMTFPQSPNAVLNNQENPSNIDRARSTVPSYIHSGYWTSTGGLSGVRLQRFTNFTNPYQAEYGCRDIYYLGSVRPGVKRYQNKSANQQAFPQCQ